MSGQREAIVKLLGDDDPETVRLVQEQLSEAGEEGVCSLRELTHDCNEVISARAAEVLASIRCRGARDDFALICHFFGGGVDLETSAWALARAIEPDFVTEPYERRVNQWGRMFLVRISSAVSNRERVSLLSSFLCGELNFRGNVDDYYNEKNSLLPSVIDARTGLPITLTLLFMMVAARAAMKIEGINLPGHFIARHGEVYFDPFHGGRILSRCDIEQILVRQGLEPSEQYLQPANCRQMMIRMLSNLLHVYTCSGQLEKQGLVRSWIDILTGVQTCG